MGNEDNIIPKELGIKESDIGKISASDALGLLFDEVYRNAEDDYN
ncbi:hypothetical protein [Clostridium saccharobutylicum]|uniref:Uncharacterized protein n=1 Tax=Clostridium saccharobutylicum DSM 13864 TaxID=1345695 RepID=U5MY79_CLOSA|nr:hypothetical protein [Clostridium saccharobutylicum]AGX44596.1 hypothetical protein CLSA_c36350 [Clostridium saccharobutylicum DSM 13864]AQR91887.1 hypothetical protein CLOSC_36150 [Clostridium saccharobutylicum]AQS01789.1 hypothetical protein CSACC_36200 [Clostridium saccharobutylicum]AQS11392.1 hypothetical protein CLOBY_35480 [Clostridium saccharobutylicum]AQS15772.1 hypothetical protein CLOSACC_36200 [Clostridium saccharobutylicum]